MKLARYLARIGWTGAVRADYATLTGLIRAHLQAAPFENLDVQLGAPLDLDPERIFDKIVDRRRGGWCYEMNGLFGWALGEIGFDVTRLSGGVMRETHGDSQLGNHLCLMVTLDRPFLVDVGFGGSLFAPIPIEPAEHDHSPYMIRLSQPEAGYWRFTETAGDSGFSFDFAREPAIETLLAQKCAELQTSPASPFVQNLVAQTRRDGKHFSLRGRVFKELSDKGAEKRLIENVDEFVSVLKTCFGLDVPAVRGLWPAICSRHDTLFPEQATR